MANITRDPWSPREADFPRTAPVSEQLVFCVRYALLAPSGHNAQPWFFAVRERAIDLYADRLRALPVVDPEDRELTISCGAALETLLIAMQRFGLAHDVEFVCSASTPDHLAHVRVQGNGSPTRNPLFDAIPRRHTSRMPYGQERPSVETVSALKGEVSDENVWFNEVPGLEERVDVADLVEEGDRIQMADSRFRRELSKWVHANGSSLRDGMPGHAFGFGDTASTLGPLVLRSFDTGASQAAKDRKLVLQAPLLALLGTTSESVLSWLSVGRTLARLLLRATAAGLSASFMNQPIEIPELRPSLGKAMGQPGFPQILLRMGKAPPVRPTPRRALEDFLAQ
jgi:hypothetical protein